MPRPARHGRPPPPLSPFLTSTHESSQHIAAACASTSIILRLAGPFTHPCVRPAPASQRRDSDSPYGLRPLPLPVASARIQLRFWISAALAMPPLAAKVCSP